MIGLLGSGFAGGMFVLAIPAWRAQRRANKREARAERQEEAIEGFKAWLGLEDRPDRPSVDHPSILDLLQSLDESNREMTAVARMLGGIERRQDEHERNPRAHR